VTESFVEWAPHRLTLRPPIESAGGSWPQLDAYAGHLAALGMPDPTKATARRVAAEHCRDLAERHVPAPAGSVNITERLAAGAMTAKEAATHFAKQPDTKEAEATAQKVRNEMATQMYALLRLAVQAIREHPWLDVLRPMATAAVAKRDGAKWNAVHAFAAWLRDPAFANVCALSAAMQNNVQDSDWTLYAFGDAGRGLYRWQVANADPRDITPGTPIPLPGGGWRMAYSFSRNVRTPNIDVIAEHAEAWGGASLFSGEEVITNQDRALAQQDREIDTLLTQPPAPAKPRTVMVP
jgi:hypothetical protein